MILRQLFDAESSTYTYLLADLATREAVIIDPVLEQIERDVTLIGELGLTLRYALDTHVHADHVTALGSLRARLDAKTVISEAAGVGNACWLVRDGEVVRFGVHGLEVRETPGHTRGCLTFVTLDHAHAFTGDALLIRGCGRTDFQDGDAHALYRSVHTKIFTLPDHAAIHPGHDYKGRTMSTVGEEKAHNARLGGARSEPEFVAIMHALDLARPAKLDLALPRNYQGGLATVSAEPTESRAWAPIERSAGGFPEVAREWVAAHLGEVRLIDVREPSELVADGAIANVESIPLAAVETALASAPRDQPIILVCRSGGRSGKAALALAALGFRAVASLRGGMRAWDAAKPR